jgi:ribosomal-protein-alanine N-acetyltransferase
MPAVAPTLVTSRLVLRPWRDEDVPAFAALSADPRVMEYFPRTLNRAESEASVTRAREHFQRHGFGKWAVEVPGVAPFVGYVGLAVFEAAAHFAPCVEIGWRLACEHWGRGYATEGAAAAVAFAFREGGLDEVVSFTVPANARSRRVMERLGMTRDPADDFDHPSIPEESPLRRHVLYRLRRDAWQEADRR